MRENKRSFTLVLPPPVWLATVGLWRRQCQTKKASNQERLFFFVRESCKRDRRGLERHLNPPRVSYETLFLGLKFKNGKNAIHVCYLRVSWVTNIISFVNVSEKRFPPLDWRIFPLEAEERERRWGKKKREEEIIPLAPIRHLLCLLLPDLLEKPLRPPSLPAPLTFFSPPSPFHRKQQLSRLSIFPFLTSFPSLPWGEVARAAPASVASLSLGRAIKKSQKRKPWGKAKEEKKGKKEQSHPPLLRDNRGAPAPSDKGGGAEERL